MKPDRIIHPDENPTPDEITPEQAEWLLAEIGRLYREKIRAHYNDNPLALQTIDEQIALLKSKLARL